MPARVTASLSGRLHVLVLDRQEDAYVLRFWLETPSGTVRTDADVQRMDGLALQHRAMARFTTDGRITGYSFGTDVPDATRTLLISIFAQSHQFVLREPEEAWTVEGLHDDVGSFTARFAWRGTGDAAGAARSLQRQIVSYDPSASQKIERSSGKATFASGWIADVKVSENRSAEVGGAFAATTALRLEMHLIERTLSPSTEPKCPRVRTLWKLRFRPAKQSTIEDAAASEPHALEVDPRVALDQALDQLAAIVASGRLTEYEGFEVWKKLADLMRRSPDVVLPELVDLVRAGKLDDGALNWILSAMGAAAGHGSAAAVAALAQMIADPSLPERVRPRRFSRAIRWV